MKCTANILTIFVRAKDYIHLDTRKAGGHFCLVCRLGFFPKINTFSNILPRDKGVRQMAYFFSGGTSTLHTYIARYRAFHFTSCNLLSNPFKVLTIKGRHTKMLHFHLRPDSKHMVHEAKMVGLLLGLHMLNSKKTREAPAMIGVDNQAAIKALVLDLRGPGHHLA